MKISKLKAELKVCKVELARVKAGAGNDLPSAPAKIQLNPSGARRSQQVAQVATVLIVD